MFTMRFAPCFLLCLIALGLSACSPAAPEVSKRYFFPPAPAEPRIEYIKGYFSDHDLKPIGKNFFTDYVLGETRPQSLFESPVDVASDGNGVVYVADSGTRQVHVLDLNSSRHHVLQPKMQQGNLERGFGFPIGVYVADDKRVYVADAVTKKIDVFNAQEDYLGSLTHDELIRPTAVAVDNVRKKVYVLDTAAHRLAVFNLDGEFLTFIGKRGSDPGQFNYPTDVDVDREGNVYVLDTLNARVQVFDAAGEFVRMFGERGTAEGSFEIPKNLAVSDQDQVYVTDALAHKLVVFSREGELLLRIGSKSVVKKGISPGGFYMPRGVDIDATGELWVVDTLNRMVHRFQFLTEAYLREHPLN